MGILGQMRRKRFASGGMGIAPPQVIPDINPPAGTASGDRAYHALDPGSYFSYGEGPEHQFFTGDIKPTPMAPGVPNAAPAPPKQDNSTNWGNVLAGIPQLGKTVSLAGDVLKGFGLDNSITQGMEKYGDMVGNPIKTGVDWYKGQGAFADYGSGDPLDAALAEKGITASGESPAVNGALEQSGILDKAGAALGTAGNLYGIYQGIDQGGVKGYGTAAKDAASLAGYDIPAIGYIDALSKAAKGDVGGAGVSAASMAAGPLAAAGFMAAGLLNKSLTGHGDEKRNMQQFLTDNPLGITGEVESGAMSRGLGPLNGYMTADGRLLDSKYINDLAGAYYGSKYTDDDSWDSKYDALLKDPKLFSSQLGGGNLFSWKDGKFVRSDGQNIDTYINQKKVAKGGSMGSGVLGQMSGQSNFVQGPGTGRSDEIPARLSPGEYVMDAETVSMLGDGSSDAGARRLDELRQNLRKHKGRKLSKGKFSDNAKDPASYMKGK